MTQSELLAHLSTHSGVAKRDVERVLDSLGTIAQKTLAIGDTLSIPGVGKLSVADRAARTGMNPATGAKVAIPAKRVAKLKPGADMVRALV